MRALAALALLPALLLLLLPTAAAYNDPYRPLEPVTDEVYPELRPYCAALLDELRAAGLVGDHAGARHMGYERDAWADAPECATLRDEVQYAAPVYDALGAHNHCALLFGKNCVATNHPACDLAILVMSGALYICQGGLTPRN